MPATIYTIGFAGKSAEQFFGLLKGAGVRVLVDIRENRAGQLSGFAKFPDIAFFLDKLAGIAYKYEPLLAPTPEIRKLYRSTKDWDQYEFSFLALIGQRNLPQALESIDLNEPTALLCSEPEPARCHRRLVAEMLAEHLRAKGREIGIRHLVVEKPPKPKRGRRRIEEP